VLWLAAFGCLWLNVLDDPPLHTGAYLQNVTADAATVAQILPAPEGLVLTVFDGDEVVGTVRSTPRRRHMLRVEGLEPGTSYRYELTAEGGGSQQGTFSTAPNDDSAPVHFAFCGDSGDQPWWVWLQRTPILHLPARWRWFPTKSAVTEVGAAMAADAPDFALHLGDVIYPKGLHAHYSSGFFRPFGDLLRGAPVYAVLGNHDVMNARGQQILANFELPENELTGDERCYSFAWGSVRVIALDCNQFLAQERFQEDFPSARFLRQELQRCSEPWVVVASHYPIRSASRQGNDGALEAAMLPVLEQWGVDLYLSGHDHCYQRFGPNERFPVPLVVSGGGGKRLYEIKEDPRSRIGAEALAKAFHWCSAHAQGRTLSVVATGIDGARLDAFELRLPEGEELEQLRARNPARARRIDALK